jgi:general transcription factor 3C polypeptide 3 (transcription factor C subunit 4)
MYPLTLTDLGTETAERAQIAKPDIPADYRGISFSAWLDIFLEFAMCLARVGKMREAYEMCEAAKDAIVFYHSREDMFLIHVAWCSELNSALCDCWLIKYCSVCPPL